jgi:hypothetical protein
VVIDERINEVQALFTHRNELANNLIRQALINALDTMLL